MAVHTLKITPKTRPLAHRWVDAAPEGMLAKFQEANRTTEQNAKLWAMLSDVSHQAEHNGKKYTKEVWKVLFMSACGHELQLMVGLNGEPVPMGQNSSKLSVAQMSELIEFIHCWAAENGVTFTERGFAS